MDRYLEKGGLLGYVGVEMVARRVPWISVGGVLEAEDNFHNCIGSSHLQG